MMVKSESRGPSSETLRRAPNSAWSITLPATAPTRRPTMAPIGPSTALPAAAPATERTRAAILQLSRYDSALKRGVGGGDTVSTKIRHRGRHHAGGNHRLCRPGTAAAIAGLDQVRE